MTTFNLDNEKQYQQQFGDMYFLRLTQIKPAVEEIASAAFDGVIVGGEPARKVERVLDVRQGELCWVAGTVYFDMPLKPNILDDVSKDVSCGVIGAPFRSAWLTPFVSGGYPRLLL